METSLLVKFDLDSPDFISSSDGISINSTNLCNFVDWKGIRAENSLPKLEKSSFEVSIDQLIQKFCKNPNILIGICPNPHKDEYRFNRIGSFPYCAKENLIVKLVDREYLIHTLK